MGSQSLDKTGELSTKEDKLAKDYGEATKGKSGRMQALGGVRASEN